MHFLVDARLPPALAKWVIGRGQVAAHVFELGLQRADVGAPASDGCEDALAVDFKIS